MMILTFWSDPPNKNDPDDYESILEVRLKTVAEIPQLVAHRPTNCTMISTEYSGVHRNKKGQISSPTNDRRFKEIWRTGQASPSKSKHCPLCGQGVQ